MRSTEDLYKRFYGRQCKMYYEESTDFVSPIKGQLLYSMTIDVPEGEEEERRIVLKDPSYPSCRDPGSLCERAFGSIYVHGTGVKWAGLTVGGMRHDEIYPSLYPGIAFHIDTIPIVAYHNVQVEVKSKAPFRMEYKIYALQEISDTFDYWFHQPQYQAINLSGNTDLDTKAHLNVTTEPIDETGVSTGRVKLFFNHPIRSLRIRAPLECNIHDIRLVGKAFWDEKGPGQPEWEHDGSFLVNPQDPLEHVCSFEPLTVNFSRMDCAYLVFKYRAAPGPACIIADALQLAVIRQGMFATRFSK